jgi:CubicO group peptidase (beta-lactamase class C family)
MNKSTILYLHIFLICWVVPSVIAQDKRAQLHALFDTLYARENFNGCVLIAENGQPLIKQAYGYADLQQKRWLDANSVFELASVSKQFTAMGILILKERGLLAYADPLQKYFPQLPYSDVRISHLLTHTSGIPDFLNWQEKDIDFSRINFNADVINKLPAIYPKTPFPVGSKFTYSNTNYILLAAIIEKCAKMSFADFLRTNIFLPLDMKHTSVYHRRANPVKIPNYAYDYRWDPGQNTFVTPDSLMKYNYYMDGMNGAYGISSTVSDLLRWDQALYAHKLVTQDTFNESISPKKLTDGGDVEEYPGIRYTYGWMLLPYPAAQPATFHTGSYGGYNTLIVRYTTKKQTVVLLSNMAELFPVSDIMTPIESILEGEQPELPERAFLKKGISTTEAYLKTLEGKYFPKGDSVHVTDIRSAANRLYIKTDNGGRIDLYREKGDTFFSNSFPVTVTFSFENTDRATRITIHRGNQEIIMLRKD